MMRIKNDLMRKHHKISSKLLNKVYYLFCHSFISCCSPNGCLQDNNVTLCFLFYFKRKKQQWKTGRFNVEVYLAMQKSKYLARRINSSGHSIVWEWAELSCGCWCCLCEEIRTTAGPAASRRTEVKEDSVEQIPRITVIQGSGQSFKITWTSKWLIGSIRLQFPVSFISNCGKWRDVQICPGLSSVVVSVCLNPNKPSCVSPLSNQAAPLPRVFNPSSSSLRFQTHLCESVQCGAPVLFGFSVVFVRITTWWSGLVCLSGLVK